MSNNFFAALDDSDNEGEAPRKKVESESKKKAAITQISQAAEKPKERRRPNNNDRNTKHGRGGRIPSRDGKRAYDRRSGTGRGKEIKKGGGGARNWGSDKQEAKSAEGKLTEHQEESTDPEAKPDEAVTEKEETENPTPEEEPESEEEPEPEDNTLSYEEYIKTKVRPESSAFAPKEERSLSNDFANVSAKVVVQEDFLVMGGAKQKKKRDKTKDKDKSIQVGFRVAPSGANTGERGDRRDGRGRGRGGRGGRGRSERDGGGRGRSERDGGGRGRGRGRGDRDGAGRGRGGRGRGRGRRDNQDINTSDADAFPSL